MNSTVQKSLDDLEDLFTLNKSIKHILVWGAKYGDDLVNIARPGTRFADDVAKLRTPEFKKWVSHGLPVKYVPPEVKAAAKRAHAALKGKAPTVSGRGRPFSNITKVKKKPKSSQVAEGSQLAPADVKGRVAASIKKLEDIKQTLQGLGGRGEDIKRIDIYISKLKDPVANSRVARDTELLNALESNIVKLANNVKGLSKTGTAQAAKRLGRVKTDKKNIVVVGSEVIPLALLSGLVEPEPQTKTKTKTKPTKTKTPPVVLTTEEDPEPTATPTPIIPPEPEKSKDPTPPTPPPPKDPPKTGKKRKTIGSSDGGGRRSKKGSGPRSKKVGKSKLKAQKKKAAISKQRRKKRKVKVGKHAPIYSQIGGETKKTEQAGKLPKIHVSHDRAKTVSKSMAFIQPYGDRVLHNKMSLKAALDAVPWFMQKELLLYLRKNGKR